MRLKSLDLLGFKSFFEPTCITFSPGITAVVGPNGCGKSNLVDAIRWVLGEQAPTRLRGKLTEDLIYAGNDANQPAGLAEVTLLLEAEADGLLPEPYSALTEIAITRRVYRSSESEYLLNKVPCRLKDISEFFMAAQIQSRGYALLEQGRIEEIIQAKAVEIRGMIEEAAGLSLFKGRREISERKLERVRENLARVDDIIAEIERQLGYARRQARKAEAYKLIRDELLGLERLTVARRIFEQREELAQHSRRQEDLRTQAEGLSAEAASLQTRAGELTAALAADREQLGEKGRELNNLRAALDERGRTRDFLERRLKALADLEPNLDLRLTELESKTTAARAARAFAGARLAQKQNSDDGVNQAQLTALREQHRAAEQALRDSEQRCEELKDELADVMREAAVTRGPLGTLAGERAELEAQLRKLNATTPELAIQLNLCRENLANAEATLGAARSAARRAEAFQRETAEREMELRALLANDSTRLLAMRETFRSMEARAQRIIPNGAGEKLRVVLQSLNGDSPASTLAMLLEVVKAPPALEPALRAVLGEHLDAVITDSVDFALRAIDILKQNESGRLSFIPHSLPPAAPLPPIEAAGIAGRLLDMVEVEPRFVPIAESLLGHVIVARDLQAALAASDANGYGIVFVTAEGDLLWPHRVISGGSGRQLEPGDEIDIRKRALALEAASSAVAVAEAMHEEMVRLDGWARLACGDDLEKLLVARQSVDQAEMVAGNARAALVKAEQSLGLAEANTANTLRRAAEVASAVVSANSRLEELAKIEQDTRLWLGETLSKLATCRGEASQLAGAILEARTRAEARKAELQALAQELSHQRQLVDELEAQIAQYRGELARAHSDRAEFQRESAALVAQDAAALAAREKLNGEVEELTKACAERASEADAAATAVDNARDALEALEEEAMQCQLGCARACTLVEELERNFHERFQADFSALAGELERALKGRDAGKDEARLQELRTRAEKIGEVNLAADSEVKALEARAGTLEAERADLRAGVNDLTQTIHKLNREARKRFIETFERAAKNFAELFPKLLRGGKGHLELTSAADVLEAGVDIRVQPPGKKVKEIGLLSGGEKALSALALIFALFLLNPSPFCVMDEVDAPLDEFSLAAFVGLMEELKTRSQFIIITHNQRTMQAADHIFGITMDRPGVSRIISLKIPDAA